MIKQVEPTEIELEGILYQVRPVGVEEGLRASAIAGNLVGPAISALGGDSDTKVAVGYLLQSPRLGEQLVALTKIFAESTEVIFPAPEGKQRTKTLAKALDECFRGRLDLHLEWFATAAEVNLGPFFAGLLRLNARAGAAISSASKSPAE